MTINAPNTPETQSLPLGPYPRIVTHAFDVPGIDQLEVYRAHGGYEALAKALRDFQPEELAEEVKESGLRGRGGAGFATGVKWGFLPKESARPRYLCVNADESEPGTFKDRMIMEVSPHQLVEGTIISPPTPRACATPSSTSAASCPWPYSRSSARCARPMRRDCSARTSSAAATIWRSPCIRGAGAYICGEESALLESLEGKRGYPRLKPPFPAVVGLYGGPTVINNWRPSPASRRLCGLARRRLRRSMARRRARARASTA